MNAPTLVFIVIILSVAFSIFWLLFKILKATCSSKTISRAERKKENDAYYSYLADLHKRHIDAGHVEVKKYLLIGKMTIPITEWFDNDGNNVTNKIF